MVIMGTNSPTKMMVPELAKLISPWLSIFSGPWKGATVGKRAGRSVCRLCCDVPPLKTLSPFFWGWPQIHGPDMTISSDIHFIKKWPKFHIGHEKMHGWNFRSFPIWVSDGFGLFSSATVGYVEFLGRTMANARPRLQLVTALLRTGGPLRHPQMVKV